MRRFLITAILVLTLAAAFSFAQDEANDVLITNAWARPTSMEMDMGDDDMEATEEASMAIPPSAAYMLIENVGDTDLRLIAAESSVAESIEIHETTIENDVMRMRELEDGLSIPAGETATLEQGGFHVMLMALTRELIPGDALPLTLIFGVVEDDELTDDTIEIYIGVPVLESAPEIITDLVIQNAWARATTTEEAPMPIPPSAVYMTITNLSGDDDTLVSANTEIAGTVEIHETTIEDDVMRMRELEDGLSIPAGETATLEQGGFHVMLLDLQEELVAGEAIAVTLVFESGAEITIGALISTETPFE